MIELSRLSRASVTSLGSIRQSGMPETSAEATSIEKDNSED